MAKCKKFVVAFRPHVDYWTHVLFELDKPLPVTPPQLVECFWPCYIKKIIEDRISCLRCLFFLHVNVIPEDKELESYLYPNKQSCRHSLQSLLWHLA